MAKLTVSSIRSQIAALEAKAARLTEVETKKSVEKVKALMKSLGVTMEHLGARVASGAEDARKAVFGKSKSAPAKRAASKRSGAGGVKYLDPKTGATWSGFGRAPAWIASAKDRAHFLVDRAAATASVAAAPTAPAKKAAKTTAKKAAKKVPRKVATTAKAAAKKVKRAAKAVTAKAAPAKKRAAAKPAAKKSAPRKAAAKKTVAASAPAQATSSDTPSAT